MSAMDLLCEPKTLVAEIGKLFSKVCNFRHFGDATFSIFALQLRYLYYAINSNVFSVVPKGKMREVAMMLKAIHAQENKKAAREKAKQVTERLKEMKLGKAAEKVEASIEETLTFMDFPSQHWTRIRTNNMLERVNREIKRRT